ncbi:hypothetical protein A0O36_00422 [Piscirickettsiaceae bacterium NZ-RLO1]|nr:hypothetical protein A0O36_00422 [Piscirickettsiaceae bacterium NZ-RLO1]
MPRKLYQISEQERKVMFIQFANQMLDKDDVGKALQALEVTTRMEIKNRTKIGNRYDPVVFDHIKLLVGEILDMGNSISSTYTDRAQQLLNSIPSGNRRLAIDETVNYNRRNSSLPFSNEAHQQQTNFKDYCLSS